MNDIINTLYTEIINSDAINKCIRLYNLPNVEMWNITFTSQIKQNLELTVLAVIDNDITHLHVINTLPRLTVDETSIIDKFVQDNHDSINRIVQLLIMLSPI